MPRGVYDRSKKKAAGATTTVKKPGPKKGNKKIVENAGLTSTNSYGFESFQSYLHSLAGVIASGVKSPNILEAVDNTIRRMELIAEERVPLKVAEEETSAQTESKDVEASAVKKRPGPKPGFKKAAKTEDAPKAVEAPANGSFIPAPFNAPPAPPRQGA